MNPNLLGGLEPQQFLDEYWQKKPLLIRQAIPGFDGVIERDALFDLACDPDVESRHICRRNGDWSLTRGPQKRSNLKGRKHPWTVLVQGLNLWLPEGDTLLRQFDFIPQSRLDDLMVSYAVDGGGVGPHFDNYDVFLLQGMGRRRWRIGDQRDRTLIPDLPLKILADFKPVHDWVLEPGDLLYLPPHWAHDGVAIGECMTYSIGFRSPTAQELGTEFLGWMQEHLALDGLYADPDLRTQENSAQISDTMLARVEEMVARIRWQREDVRGFLGCYLTEPKPHVFFEPPDEAMDFDAFEAAIRRTGFHLDARTLLLFSAERFFLNGEILEAPPQHVATLARLAHARRLCSDDVATQGNGTLAELLYELYCDGFGHPGERP